MSTPFRDSALAYAQVLTYLKTLKPGVMATIGEIYQAISKSHGYVRNPQQVADALKSYYAKGQVSRIREGRNYAYWAKAVDVEPSAAPIDMSKHAPVQVEIPQVGLSKIPGTDNKPEIVVTSSSIIINHAKCKITIEF
jgi:hypothetical protein